VPMPVLGTMRDAELAKKLNRSVSSVRSRRNDKTSVRFINTPNAGLHLNCVYLVVWRMRKSRVVLDDFWRRCATSGFNLASHDMRPSIDPCHSSFGWDVGDPKRSVSEVAQIVERRK
jgi:hypothetical protein